MVDKCFITIPAKPTEEANFQTPLKRVLGTQYSKQSAENAMFAVKELEGLRRNAIGRVLDRTHTSLEILHRYSKVISLSKRSRLESLMVSSNPCLIDIMTSCRPWKAESLR